MRRVTVASLVAAVLTGCGGQLTNRSVLATYISRLGLVERQLASPLTAVTAVATRLLRSPTPATYARSAASLKTTLAEIESLRGRAAALAPPPEASRLRVLTLASVGLQAHVTGELLELARFQPALGRALEPLGPAIARLSGVLTQQTAYGASGVTALYAAKAQALRRFKTVVEAIRRRVRQLVPPPFSRTGWSTELASLTGMGAGAAKLATALEAGATGDVSTLVARFDAAAAATPSAAAQRAEAAAVRSYNAQLDRLDRLTIEIEAERQRLQRVVA